MSDDLSVQEGTIRRDFLKAAGAASVLAAGLIGTARAQTPAAPSPAKARAGLNILFVFTDQERYHASWPKGLTLPGHERLQRSGVTFTNHQCPATMCTSSRSVIVTGLQTADNGMFENLDVPWMRDLSTSHPTIGHMLRKAGYYTAYKGKWHLSRDFDTHSVEKFMTPGMERYGFADNFSPGDLIGHTLGGYSFDQITAGSAINWLRTKGRPLSDDGKPWCMFVSFVNPHDVMYFNTDAPGESVQDTGRLRLRAARAPEHALYRASWDIPIPASLRQPFDAPGRPGAHGEFDHIWDYILGNVPLEDARWKRFNDYYMNCIRNVDQQIEALLAELDALKLAQDTIVVFTADHGEMAGSHGLRGKGPFAYRETTHLPLHIVHPDVQGGQQCRSLSGHIDFVPTLLSMAGVAPDRAAELAGRALPGKDLSPLLANPGSRTVDAARPATLFTYSGLASNDGGVFDFAARAVMAGKDPKAEAKRVGYKPDLTKRGHVRSAFDGRYRFTRYFSPLDHNSPTTLDELFKWNDVELYDLDEDPGEMANLAIDRAKNADLLAAMNGKLEALIRSEIGKDDGRELPDIAGITWGVDRVDL
ncbi:sulfatase-like hydrolase/transferase [Enhydrobacter sp.]|uniref:sulfatase-like hydrolase/transferase n=1 Tax=Enhydrobacter sp. TaxID=1894999 RepID=UPI00260524A5|nr:sulfatase-like hydrolase/transferase [Enhydrobacter sp.]WIM09131.1 MAG: sulfatase-like hydrolase/transferase [Enhydrobacter sp.]